MKRLFFSTIILFSCLSAFSQNEPRIKVELPLLTITNNQFSSIVDSIVGFSEKCDKNNLKSLTFEIEIKEVTFNYYQIFISLMDCQGLDYVLRLTDERSKPFGFFINNKHIFIVSGCCNPEFMFHIGNVKKEFSSHKSDLLWHSDYSLWVYTFEYGEKFQLYKFYPICDENRSIPECQGTSKTE